MNACTGLLARTRIALVLCLAACTGMDAEQAGIESGDEVAFDESVSALDEDRDAVEGFADEDTDPVELIEGDSLEDCEIVPHVFWQCCGCGMECEFDYICKVCDTWGECTPASATGRTRAGNCPPPC
jgi:hypothetical protein